MRLFHITSNSNVESILKRGFSVIDEVRWLEGVCYGVPLSSKPREYRIGRQQGLFDYSQGFRFGGGYPAFGDTLITVNVPEWVVTPFEATLEGRIESLFESLSRQFIPPALVLNECDESLMRIVTNELDLNDDVEPYGYDC